MTLTPGTRLGPYEIQSALGAGGIFYLAPNGKMMAVEVSPGEDFRVETPTPIFQTPVARSSAT